jgi:hypothetical protein
VRLLLLMPAIYRPATASRCQTDAYLARVRWKLRCLIMLGELWLERGRLDEVDHLLAEHDDYGVTNGFPFPKLQARAMRLKAALLTASFRERLIAAPPIRALLDGKSTR